MQLYNQEYLPLFWIVPLLLALSYWYALKVKRTRLQKLGVLTTLNRISDFSIRDWRLKVFTAVLAVVFLMFSLLRPQWGEEKILQAGHAFQRETDWHTRKPAR